MRRIRIWIVVIGALFLIDIWMYVASLFLGLGAGDIMVGVSIVIVLAGLWMIFIGSKKEAKRKGKGDDNFLAIGNHYYQQRNYLKAEKCYKACLANSQDDSEKATALSSLADLYRDIGRRKESMEHLGKALVLYEKLAQKSPEVYKHEVQRCLWFLGKIKDTR
jgi:tetratricopeptide (TPR) repeat protein